MKILFEKKLISGKFQRRYKRFFSDVLLENGETITVHCPNTGSMKTCISENIPALISKSDNPKRKLAYTLEATMPESSWVGVNTHKPNKWVKQWIEASAIQEFKGYKKVTSEVKINSKTRLDLLLENKNKKLFVEIKNVTLKTAPGEVGFPDSVTERGKKHLIELTEIAAKGDAQAAMFFLINRSDCKKFRIASEIDPEYAKALKASLKAGVKLIAYKSRLSDSGISILNKIPVEI